MIEIGWINFKENDQSYHQVRAKNGGLPRNQEIQKDATKADILSVAKEKIFPKEGSKLGKWNDFEVDMLDFAQQPLDETETVGEMYDRTGIKRLRFHLATKSNTFDKTDGSPKPLTKQINVEHVVVETPVTTTQTKHIKCLSLLDPSIPPTSIFSDNDDSSDLLDPDISNDSVIVQFKDDICIQPQEPNNNDTNNDTLPYVPFDILALAAASAGIEPTAEDQIAVHYPSTDNSKATPSPPTDDIIKTPSPRSPSPPPPEGYTRTVRLHRVNIEQEMVTNFVDPSIMSESIKFKFVDEKGVDAEGVSREAYVTFWDEFMTNSTKGEAERIPLVKPSMQKVEWEAIGRILAKGFSDHGIFPLKLSKVFTIAIVYGEEAVTSDDMFTSLMQYVAPMEKDAIMKALEGTMDDRDDYDDFIEVLTRLGSKNIPKGDQVKPTVLKVAQKELIQTSKYALDAISSQSKETLRFILTSPQSIRDMYNAKIPTNRKVAKLLEAQETGKDQDRCFGYLKQFVKALDDNTLRQFLRHVTGADMICVNRIEVHFNVRYGINRFPVVRTCTPMIELSTTYSSYPDFRAEFSALLKVHHPLDID